ncbi:MAG TPA: T9SS type A sorting domain-containing protein, partial [Candidatus Marinimicrobia bacterium]|nr:T9SS type A sorting domain-containing protein [Candidatus Neomarinimicrobiota bacterium]
SKFSLAQNYPNPFNPTTQIKYTIPYDARVSLKVYNTLGQEVANLVDGTQSAGEHIVTFDSKNLAGGIYFYTLKSEGVNITKKLVLIK